MKVAPDLGRRARVRSQRLSHITHIHTVNLETYSPNTIEPHAISAIYVAISPFSQTFDLFNMKNDITNITSPKTKTPVIIVYLLPSDNASSYSPPPSAH